MTIQYAPAPIRRSFRAERGRAQLKERRPTMFLANRQSDYRLALDPRDADTLSREGG